MNTLAQPCPAPGTDRAAARNTLPGRIAALVLLCLSAPAHAATVQLDLGDAGLHWIEGVGFRPVDGIDLWLSKYDCPRVGSSWKDAATDRVGRETKCNEPLSGGATVAQMAEQPPCKRQVAGSSPCRWHHPSAGTLLDRSVRTVWDTWKPVSSPALDPPPAPVPLPASVWLMLAAVGMLFFNPVRCRGPQRGFLSPVNSPRRARRRGLF